MRLHAAFILTVLVLQAHTASIEKILSDVEKQPVKDVPIENVSSEQELIDQANTIKDIENNLRINNKEVVDIPVKVIVEDAKPSLKTDLDNVEVPDESEEISRPLVDLRNPGPPQHQEHETQNPEHHEDAEKIASAVKNDINVAQITLRQGFQEVSEDITKWFARNEQINNLQASLQHFQDNFAAQIQKLNETLQLFTNTENVPAETPAIEKQNQASFQTIESGLKSLETNFNSGLKQISEGVKVVATLKADGETPVESSSAAPAQSTTSAPGSNLPAPVNALVQIMNNFQSSVSSGFQNVTTAINNFVTQNQGWGIQNIFGGGNQPAPQSGAQNDATPSTQRPTPWQNIAGQITNFFNPGQNNAGTQQNQPAAPAPSGPFAGLQNPFNFLLPNRPAAQTPQKPAEAPNTANTASAAPEAQKPESKPDPEKKPEQPESGPLKQMFENNPVVQGIAGAVKRIQTTINNPVKPRDTVEETKSEQEKGGIILLPVKGHGGHGGGGDNNSVGGGMSEIEKPEIEEIKAPTEEKKEDVKEKETENKTE